MTRLATLAGHKLKGSSVIVVLESTSAKRILGQRRVTGLRGRSGTRRSTGGDGRCGGIARRHGGRDRRRGRSGHRRRATGNHGDEVLLLLVREVLVDGTEAFAFLVPGPECDVTSRIQVALVGTLTVGATEWLACTPRRSFLRLGRLSRGRAWVSYKRVTLYAQVGAHALTFMQ